jgi:hypothetical protein
VVNLLLEQVRMTDWADIAVHQKSLNVRGTNIQGYCRYYKLGYLVLTRMCQQNMWCTFPFPYYVVEKAPQLLEIWVDSYNEFLVDKIDNLSHQRQTMFVPYMVGMMIDRDLVVPFPQHIVYKMFVQYFVGTFQEGMDHMGVNL